MPRSIFICLAFRFFSVECNHRHAQRKATHSGCSMRRARFHAHAVLLLRRRSKHNHNTWGLPGGNMDDEDEGDLLRTALREGVEELGQLPASYTQVGAMLTK